MNDKKPIVSLKKATLTTAPLNEFQLTCDYKSEYVVHFIEIIVRPLSNVRVATEQASLDGRNLLDVSNGRLLPI